MDKQDELAEMLWRADQVRRNGKRPAVSWEHASLDHPRYRCLAAAVRAYMESPEVVDFEGLGDALAGLSARLLSSGFLKDSANHAAYEKVVAEFQIVADRGGKNG